MLDFVGRAGAGFRGPLTSALYHDRDRAMFSDGLSEKLIAAAVTGALSFAFAWVLRGIDRNRSFKDKRVEHALSTIAHMSNYIESWRRLIAIACLQESRKLNKEEDKRMAGYITQRDEAKNILISNINTLPLFFKQPVVDEFSTFKKWDGSHSTKRLSELPSIKEWDEWLLKLSRILRSHIQ